MIRLIASDVDGTILQNGSARPSDELFTLIQTCREKGIMFAVASGRQHPNLRRLFAPLKDDLFFVAENGGAVMHRDKRLFGRAIPKEMGRRIIRDILANKDHELLLCCEQTCYLQPKSRAYVDDLLYRLGNTVTVVKNAEDVDEEWLKISACIPGNHAADEVGGYIERWGGQLYVSMAGAEWIDFSCASKGTALRFLQSHLAISKDETLAIGDNFNDIEMFLAAGSSYAMKTAAPQVREQSGAVASTVEEVLKNVLAEMLAQDC